MYSPDEGLILRSKTEHPKMSGRGPDVMSKSKRSQQQHANSWIRAINQTVMMAIDVLMNPAAPVAGVSEA